MTPAQQQGAVRHLARVDARLGRAIRRIGPPRLVVRKKGTHFEHLVGCIAAQQVTGRAAETIFNRVAALGGDNGFPVPEHMLSLGADRLRAAGLSRQKAAAVMDLSRCCTDGTVRLSTLGRLRDDDVVDALTTVKGIGRWTAEMVLIFRLGRPDVLPLADYGVQKGLMRLDGLERVPRPQELEARGARWAPWRSMASWYLWRVSEEA